MSKFTVVLVSLSGAKVEHPASSSGEAHVCAEASMRKLARQLRQVKIVQGNRVVRSWQARVTWHEQR